MASIDRKKIESNGWRQGSACYVEELYKILGEKPPPGSDKDLALVISQDCDVVHHSKEFEPDVEWLFAIRIDKTNSALLYGKNPRRFHFEHQGFSYEILAHNRRSTSRGVLMDFSARPTESLSPSLTRQIANWFSKRYNRPAFPDGFNDRVSAKRKAIEDAVDQTHELLRTILIRVEPSTEELAPETPYSISIFGIMRNDDFEDSAKRERCQTLMSEVEHTLDDCAGVEVSLCELRSDEQITLADLDYLVPWDFDYLTAPEK